MASMDGRTTFTETEAVDLLDVLDTLRDKLVELKLILEPPAPLALVHDEGPHDEKDLSSLDARDITAGRPSGRFAV